MGKIKLFAVARRFDRDWFRRMGGLANQCARFPLDRSGDSTVPTLGERKEAAH